MHKLWNKDTVQGAQVIAWFYKVVCIKYRANSEEINTPGSYKWQRKHVQEKKSCSLSSPAALPSNKIRDLFRHVKNKQMVTEFVFQNNLLINFRFLILAFLQNFLPF